MGLDNEELMRATETTSNFNPTDFAIEAKGNPYLSDAFTAIFGITNLFGNGASRALELIRNFLLNLSEMYYPPAVAARVACTVLVGVHSLLWFTLYAAASFCWVKFPTYFVASS